MPPRLQLFSGFRIHNARCFTPVAATRNAFSTTIPSRASSTKAKQRRTHDPYAQAQARARKAANLSRQAELKATRDKALGDPVLGITTPFVESFDTATPPEPSPPLDTTDQPPTPSSLTSPPPEPADHYFNHFVTRPEAEAALLSSYFLTKPPEGSTTSTIAHQPNSASTDPAKKDEATAAHAAADENAMEAMTRILSLSNGSGKERALANTQRCIAVFGRHNTDAFLRPKPPSIMTMRNPALADPDAGDAADPPPSRKTPRAGPDTGSSEVQIALLTAKIRAVSALLDTRGKKDHANRRNLRLLVHRRQKLLQYLRRKERGGERWLHCIQTLGLTEGTWRGEITL